MPVRAKLDDVMSALEAQFGGIGVLYQQDYRRDCGT